MMLFDVIAAASTSLFHLKADAPGLAAVREMLDRLIGKPAVFVDATHTSVNLNALYLEALKRANEPKAVDAEPLAPNDPRPTMPAAIPEP